jgi:hypothetical protein
VIGTAFTLAAFAAGERVSGKESMREQLAMAKSKSASWQALKFVNLGNKKIVPRQADCEQADELVVCGGIDKPV